MAFQIGFIGVLGTSLLTLHISHLEDFDISLSPLIYDSVARMIMGRNWMTIPWLLFAPIFVKLLSTGGPVNWGHMAKSRLDSWHQKTRVIRVCAYVLTLDGGAVTSSDHMNKVGVFLCRWKVRRDCRHVITWRRG